MKKKTKKCSTAVLLYVNGLYILRKYSNYVICTFMCVVKGSEGDNKEGSRVFPSINQVREGPVGVAITSQALDKSKPGRKTLDHCADPIGVGITNIFTCRETDTCVCRWLCRPFRITFIHSSLVSTVYPNPNVLWTLSLTQIKKRWCLGPKTLAHDDG